MKENEKFIIIPEYVYKSKKLSYTGKILFGFIYSLCLINEEHKCYANNKYFSDALNINIKNLCRYIKELKSTGYIAVNYSDTKPKRVITINSNDPQNYDIFLKDDRNCEGTTPPKLRCNPRKNDEKTSSELRPYNIYNNNKDNKNDMINNVAQKTSDVMEFFNNETFGLYVEKSSSSPHLVARILQGYTTDSLKNAVVNMVNAFYKKEIPFCLSANELFKESVVKNYLGDDCTNKG